MDQNIVLNITNTIIVLVAALVGAALTYYFSLSQEKRRKKREVIEELYGLAYKLKVEVDEYLYWIQKAGHNSKST